MVRGRPLAAAVPAPRRRLVDRGGTGQEGGLRVGDDPGWARHRLHRRARRLRDPRPRYPRRGARRRPDRAVPRGNAGTPAHRARGDRAADGDRAARAHARVQPAAPPAGLTVHGHGPLGRLDHGGLPAARPGGPPDGRQGRSDERHGQGEGADQGAGGHPHRGRGPRRPGTQHPGRTGATIRPVADEPDGLDGSFRWRQRRAVGATRSRRDGPRGRRPDGPGVPERDRLDPAGHRPARAATGGARRRHARP